MSLTWAEIIDLYHNGCGNAQFAFKERFTHVTEAYRGASSLLELPELYMPNATIATVANQDWVEVDPDVYSLVSASLKDTGLKLTPEPGGFRGRQRYYESDQVRPPVSGSVSFYVRKGNRVYLRDTPDAIMTLIFAFRMHPPPVTSSTDLTEHPITPQQYDMALVRWAMGSYYSIHPPQVGENAFDLQKGPSLVKAAQEMLIERRNPAAEEKLDTQHYMRQQGYDFGIGR
jgi:hypothetical protein